MRRRDGGFLILELTLAVMMAAGFVVLLVHALTAASDAAVEAASRSAAADRLEEVLDLVRHGELAFREGVVKFPSPKDDRRLREGLAQVTVAPRSDIDGLSLVTATITWKGPHGAERSMTAHTFVRTARLRFEEKGR